ncbi:aldo/keto reductase [Beijerinckia sp. L45]|uniref:aldo/keto reductase n=1 Tax=Beijerinckia sp. L45 TaxID=1641855 RepID=UPI00131E43F1|nr:aldo/keto reductase [Beijerinckia sp. L45]
MAGKIFLIGGDLPVHRLGFGAMRLTGPGVWGPPQDPHAAAAVLRRAVDLGIDFIDTADVYGPGDNERLIRDTLAPYKPGLVIGTKGGMIRCGPATPGNPGMSMDGSAAHIRRAVEGSLRDLGVECIDLYQLHRVDPATPIEETMAVFLALRTEGKIRHVGLSEVGTEQIERARSVVEVATVQNRFNLTDRRHHDVLVHCEQHGIGFIPFYPLGAGTLTDAATVATIAARTGASSGQVALAWLLQKSPVTLLIPGTSSLTHLEQNVAARDLVLNDAEMTALEQMGQAPVG